MLKKMVYFFVFVVLVGAFVFPSVADAKKRESKKLFLPKKYQALNLSEEQKEKLFELQSLIFTEDVMKQIKIYRKGLREAGKETEEGKKIKQQLKDYQRPFRKVFASLALNYLTDEQVDVVGAKHGRPIKLPRKYKKIDFSKDQMKKIVKFYNEIFVGDALETQIHYLVKIAKLDRKSDEAKLLKKQMYKELKEENKKFQKQIQSILTTEQKKLIPSKKEK